MGHRRPGPTQHLSGSGRLWQRVLFSPPLKRGRWRGSKSSAPQSHRLGDRTSRCEGALPVLRDVCSLSKAAVATADGSCRRSSDG